MFKRQGAPVKAVISRPSDDMAALQAACTQLRRAMRITAGARFNASKRLADHDKRLNVSVALLSFYIISVGVFQIAYRLEEASEHILSLVCVLLSIGVLVLSLLQYASSDAVHSEQHHRCALDIDEVRRQLDICIANPSFSQLKEIVNDYSRILQNSNLNHDNNDMLMYVIDRPELGMNVGTLDGLLVRARVWFFAYLPYLLVFGVGVFVAWLVGVYGFGHLSKS